MKTGYHIQNLNFFKKKETEMKKRDQKRFEIKVDSSSRREKDENEKKRNS